MFDDMGIFISEFQLPTNTTIMPISTIAFIRFEDKVLRDHNFLF